MKGRGMSERKDGFMAFEIDYYALQAAAQKVWEEAGHDGHYTDGASLPEVYEDIARPIILAYLTELEGPSVEGGPEKK